MRFALLFFNKQGGDFISRNSVGQVSFDLTADDSQLTASIKNASKKIRSSFKQTFSNTAAMSEMTKTEILSDANAACQRIKEILSDTEKTAKSKAASIAAVYKQQGFSASDALKKAWSDVGTSAGKSFGETSGLSSKIKSKFQKDSEETSQSIANSFKSTFKNIALAVSTKALIDFGKQCVETAADVKASNSQFSQTFGNLKNNAESAIQRVADASGIVPSRLQGVGTSIYAFAKTSGMDSANALGMMEEALQVTADSAAYYDQSLEATSESLKSFLKGNFENDAALGLSCTETTRNAAANKLYGTSFINLSEAQKQLTLLQMVKDANKLSGAMGQAAREADGWENVTGNLKESWKQFLGVIGQPILKNAVNIIQKITAAVQTLTSSVKEAFGWGSKDEDDPLSTLSDSSAKTTENLENSVKAVEELKRSTAGFDQLNILTGGEDKSETTDATVTSGSNVSVVPETTIKKSNELSTVSEKVKKSIDKICSSIKSLWNSSGFQNVLKGVKTFIVEASPDALACVGDLVNIFSDLINLDWKGLLNHLEDFGGDLIALSGDAALAVTTALFGEDDDITKNVKSALDEYKITVEEYDLPGGIASLLKNAAMKVLRDTDKNGTANFLATWWNNCYNIFLKSLKKGGLSGALKNMFKYALDTSKPQVTLLITEWGNHIINAFNKIIDGVNWFLGTSFSKLPKLEVSKTLQGVLAFPDAYYGGSSNSGSATVPLWPKIPKLASGGIAYAPTLSLIGDNKNARIDPEVVAPLSKLQEMVGMDENKIIGVLYRICDLLANQSDTYENNIYLDSEKIESRVSKVQRRKQRRYGGAF